MAIIKEALPTENYKLKVTMNSGNYLEFDMKPLLDTVQFCPLKDRRVWMNARVRDSLILWEGGAKVELSIDTLLNYFA